MKVESLGLPGVLVLEPSVFGDERGFFMESFNRRTFAEVVGRDVEFVQDNHSRSVGGVLRGLHYQLPNPQGKLVRVVRGSVWDVAVDLRRCSATFKQWAGVELNADNKRQLWIPEGFGHGFLSLEADTEVLYKTTAYYDPACDRSLRWNDNDIGVEWPLPAGGPVLSAKDAGAPLLQDSVLFD